MSKWSRYFLIALAGVIMVSISFLIWLGYALDGLFDGPSYSKNDLIKNYELREREIQELKRFFVSIVPEDITVTIELSDQELQIFHVIKNGVHDSNWNLSLKSQKTDSLMNELSWSKSTLEALQTKLEEANCIYVSNEFPFTIGWQRSAMGLYFYKIFESPLTEEEILKYNDGCTYSYYKENVVLEYGGGVFGPQCFQEFYQVKTPPPNQ